MPESLRAWLDVLKRQWWVVLLTMAVAAAVPYVSTRTAERPEPTYEGEARIAVEPGTLSAYYRLPRVEELLKDVTSKPYMERLAADVKVDPVELAQRVKIFSLSDPQSAIAVTYRSTEETEALHVAEAVAKNVAERAIVLGRPEVAQLKREIRLTESAIEKIEALGVEDDASIERIQRANAARNMWDMRLRLSAMREGLAKIKSAYRHDAPTTARELPVIERRASGMAGALLAGLAAGLAIAAVREALRSRKLSRQA